MSAAPKLKRKHASILFTDISRFTEKMSGDEDYAYSLIEKKRQLLLPLITQKDGKLIKQIGDGTLSEYRNVVNAVHCARDFQHKLSDRSDFEVRAGIHYGEIIEEDQDVFGYVVNIASRLETMAKPGSVFISREAIDQIGAENDLEFVPLGLQALKGVGRLVDVYALNAPGVHVPDAEDYKITSVHAHSDNEVPSIAVIPFENKGEVEDVFYAYGISSELISDISGAGAIRVASMKNIENLKNVQDMTLEEIAAKLFVRYIATGTLWKMGDLFQLSIELYDTKNSSIVWSDNWQEKWKNLTEIKGNLSDGLLKSLAAERNETPKPAAQNSEAYEFYLKGKYKYEKRRNTEDLEIARQLLNKALELDEYLISARIVLGNTYNESGDYPAAFTLFDKARNYAKELDDKPGIASALNSIGNIHLLKGEYEKAEKIYQSSLEIRTYINNKLGIASSLNNLGNLYRRKGDYTLALAHYKKSLAIFEELEDNPGIATALTNVGVMQRLRNDFENSLKSYQRAFTIREEMEDLNGMGLLLNNIGNVYFMQDDIKQALIHYSRSLVVVRKTGNKIVIANTLNNKANIYFAMADYEQALKIFTESLGIRKNLSDKNGIASSFLNIGIIHSILGQYDIAMTFFEKSQGLREELNDKVGLVNVLINIGKLSLRTEQFETALSNFNAALKNQLELDPLHSQVVELKIRILLADKKLGNEPNQDETAQFIQTLTDLDAEMQFDVFRLTGDDKYLKAAYDQLMEQSEQLNLSLKNKFAELPLNKQIIDDYSELAE